VTIDLKDPEGHGLLARLVKKADVFIENNVPETLEHLNISYEWLKECKPDIIMVRMPGYGTTGPYKNYRATGNHVNSAVGHTYLMGHPGEDLSRRGSTNAADANSGVAAAFCVAAALWYRRRTGKGQLIESTLAENLIPFMAESILDYRMNNRVRETVGNRHRQMAPHGVYPCRGEDKWLTLGVGNDEEWRGLCKAMGNTELALDPRFADSHARWHNQDALDAIIREWTQQQDHIEAFHLLQRYGVTSGAVLDAGEILSDPQMAARDFYQPLDHPEMPTYKYTGPFWRMSKTPNRLRSAPPLLGQHNPYVYKELLRISDKEYARLEEKGHIGMDMAPDVP
jgi:crotonobetainyl-CoA:carnitine CoA-transferase CaiB-like acyl-CoA transferase